MRSASATFGSGAATCSLRTPTTALTNWTPGNWSAGNWYTSPDMAAPVQEVIDRAGWAENNDLSVLVQNHAQTLPAGNGYRIARSWNYSGHVAGPKFNASYTTGAAASKVPLMMDTYRRRRAA